MDGDEHSKTVEYLTRVLNEEMALREQLDIIRILNPDMKFKSTDTQFVIGKSTWKLACFCVGLLILKSFFLLF
jgi:hypothetical protein